jgi:glycosyltransferase involved in cell wall biosynthesis
MRSLHVAALPFPSPQGTQALIDAMLRALHEAGHESHLVCYAHGLPGPKPPYFVHRAADVVGNRSTASGPSLAKLVDDLALVLTVRKLVDRISPDIVVAHHVEAAAALVAAGIRPWLFVTHTSLSGELAEYFAPRFRRPLQLAGRAIDRSLCTRAARTVAVSPSLASRLAQESGANVLPISLPWPVPHPITEQERRAARRTLELAHDDQVALYAGNLDAYQGLSALGRGLGQWLHTQARGKLLIATHDSPLRLLNSPLGPLAPRSLQLPIHDEASRRLAHAAADVALVPRKSPGGIPIKLLDALARGVPVLATQRATCGLTLGVGCRVLADDEPRVWHEELEQWFSERRALRKAVSKAAVQTASELFAPERFVHEFVEAASGLFARRASSDCDE